MYRLNTKSDRNYQIDGNNSSNDAYMSQKDQALNANHGYLSGSGSTYDKLYDNPSQPLLKSSISKPEISQVGKKNLRQQRLS